MSTELLSPEVGFDPLDSHEKESEEDKIAENMEHEIECPRCNDIMTLSSDFDSLFLALAISVTSSVLVIRVLEELNVIREEASLLILGVVLLKIL
jgi:hypothetical protein